MAFPETGVRFPGTTGSRGRRGTHGDGLALPAACSQSPPASQHPTCSAWLSLPRGSGRFGSQARRRNSRGRGTFPGGGGGEGGRGSSAVSSSRTVRRRRRLSPWPLALRSRLRFSSPESVPSALFWFQTDGYRHQSFFIRPFFFLPGFQRWVKFIGFQ